MDMVSGMQEPNCCACETTTVSYTGLRQLLYPNARLGELFGCLVSILSLWLPRCVHCTELTTARCQIKDLGPLDRRRNHSTTHYNNLQVQRKCTSKRPNPANFLHKAACLLYNVFKETRVFTTNEIRQYVL